MLIGILSDSHGRVEATRAAVNSLCDRGTELLLHLGDICGESVLDELIGHRARIVFGNCDDDLRSLTHYADAMGIHVDHPMGTVRDSGKTIAFTHGDHPQLMEQALRNKVDYLLHGHTHETRDERIGPTRIINPGALFRANRYTAALLDPAADRLEFIEIPRT